MFSLVDRFYDLSAKLSEPFTNDYGIHTFSEAPPLPPPTLPYWYLPFLECKPHRKTATPFILVFARFYGLSAKLSEPFTNDGKDLVLQLSIKNEQKLDCGGAYIKLTGDMDQDSFGGDTPYQVMVEMFIELLHVHKEILL